MLSPPPFVPAAAPSAKCAPARPISAYQIHGTADTTEPLGGSSSGCAVGGPCGPGAPQWQPSAGTVDSWWRTLDHCSEPTTASNARGTTSLATCADSTQVGLALVNGVGHDLAKLAAAFPIGRTLIELSLGRPPEW
jgi:poly(3-hydroxybutyrate) depolymerase